MRFSRSYGSNAVSIHSQPGPRPTPRVLITVPQNAEPRGAEPESEPTEPPKIAEAPKTVEPMKAPRVSESTPMRASRVRAIWGMTLFSLMPGAVVAVAQDFWHGLPSWGHYTAYTFSGILILVLVGLIVKRDAPTNERKHQRRT